MLREIRTESYAQKKRQLAKNYDNLEKGKDNRFKKNDNHEQTLTKFWKTRKQIKAYELINKPLDNRN
jgi:hypothetical protein